MAVPGSRRILLIVAAAWLAGALPGYAQVERLPPALATDERLWSDSPEELRAPEPLENPSVSVPPSPGELAAPVPGPESAERDPDEPRGARPGVFQKALFESTWLAKGREAGDFGMTDLDLRTVLGFPFPTRKSPLVVTPGFGVHFFEGSRQADLPGQVYDAYTQFRWLRRLSPCWGLDLSVTPGWYSDFKQGSGEALRISGYGAAMYTWNPATKLVLGVAYLDRQDVNFLPVGGLIWNPSEDLSFELISPRPRIARRINWLSPPSEDQEDWLYVAGEFGGGAWAIRRGDGLDDFISYRDYRLLLGAERKRIGRLSASLEVGYVFGRKLEYLSGLPDLEPADTFLVRGGLSY